MTPIRRGLGLVMQQLHSARKFNRIRIVLGLERGVDRTVLHERAETADTDGDLRAVSDARPRLRGSLNSSSASASVIVWMLWFARRLAKRGLSSSSFVPICANGPKRPRRTEMGLPLAGSSPSTRAGRLGTVDGFVLLFDQFLERRPEALHQRHPVFLATADRIEFVFELRGEVVVDVAGEVAAQELADRATHVGRAEAARVERHVLAREQGLDDAGVGRRTTDAEFFERLDQRWLRRSAAAAR